ncbi:MAG: hypothetical protein IT316_12100 [Anaerolineales bacterium]|nr:hypothetical protein [Anaerolineales bacterium]
MDMDSRLRVTRGIGKDETRANLQVFQTLKRWGHPDGPPPLLSDGWGGIDDAILAVYGLVPEYSGRGRPPTRPKPGKDWRYLQMVKQQSSRGSDLGGCLLQLDSPPQKLAGAGCR